jgi:hypothetical protein
MATYAKMALSGSTNGKGILLAATTSPGTAIHTAVTGTTNFDEVWIYVDNTNTTSVTLYLEFGGTTATDTLTVAIASQTGWQLITPGFLLQNGLYIKAYASVTNKLVVQGFVNRITA